MLFIVMFCFWDIFGLCSTAATTGISLNSCFGTGSFFCNLSYIPSVSQCWFCFYFFLFITNISIISICSNTFICCNLWFCTCLLCSFFFPYMTQWIFCFYPFCVKTTLICTTILCLCRCLTSYVSPSRFIQFMISFTYRMLFQVVIL